MPRIESDGEKLKKSKKRKRSVSEDTVNKPKHKDRRSKQVRTVESITRTRDEIPSKVVENISNSVSFDAAADVQHTDPARSTVSVEPFQAASKHDRAPNDDEKLKKIVKAIGKYLRKNGIARHDLEASIRKERVSASGFYDFAKKFFASTSKEDFESLTERALLGGPIDRSRDMSTKSENCKRDAAPNDVSSTVQVEAHAPSNEFKRARKRAQNHNTDDAVPVGEYIPGPFDEEERLKVASEAQDYSKEHNMTESEFCNKIWDEKLDRIERRELYARFYELLPSRKPRSIRDYMRRAFMPYERGPFTENDDAEITRLHKQLGADWKAIGHVLGRYPNDVRDRYRNHLETQALESGPWSEEEVEKLLQILATFKSREDYNWTTVAQKMGTRSRPQCRDRFHRLQRERKHGPAAASTTQSKTNFKRKVLEGDKKHMLELIQKSGVSKMSDVQRQHVLAAYDDVFEFGRIHKSLQTLLDKTDGKTFRERVSKALISFSAAEIETLPRTLLDE